MNIYSIAGGIGKQIAFTALLPKIGEKEKVYILSPYPDIFQHSPYVERSLPLNMPFVWTDYVQKEENKIFIPEPYHNSDFIHRKIHVIEGFCRELNIDYNKDMLPYIQVGSTLQIEADRFAKENQDFIIVQFSSGQSPLMANLNQEFNPPMQRKNYPPGLAQKLINKIHVKYPDLKILCYGLPNELKLEHTFFINSPYLFYIELLKKCKTFIGIDSSLNHMSACAKKKGIVLWMGTSPIHFAYKQNINLSGNCSANNPHCSRPYLRDLGDIDSAGKIWNCSNPTCQYIDPDAVFEYFEKLI